MTSQVCFILLTMKTQIWNIYSQTSRFYAFKPVFDLSLSFLLRDQYSSLGLNGWLCGLLMKQSSFLLTKLKAPPSKKWIPSQSLGEKWHLIYNCIRPRDEFLLTHCWGEMFDLQHYVQSGDKLLCVSSKEKSKINGENVSHDSFLRLNRTAAICPNNYEQSWVAHLLQPIIGTVWKLIVLRLLSHNPQK